MEPNFKASKVPQDVHHKTSCGALKNKNIKKTSAADVIATVAPHLQDIINYGAHGTAILGAGALGYVPYKLRKIDKESKSKGKKQGGAVLKARGGTFKGTF